MISVVSDQMSALKIIFVINNNHFLIEYENGLKYLLSSSIFLKITLNILSRNQ
jgi:hypothetical protein